MTRPSTNRAAIGHDRATATGGGAPTAGHRVDGRLLVVAAVAASLGGVAIAHAFGADAWHSIGVNPAPTLFYDARNVAAAADCSASGRDPLIDNPCDPAGRVMNYPRVWLLLHHVGVTQDRTLVFGGIVVALFLGSVVLVLGRLSLPEGVIAAVAVVSPAVMLAIERANMDLVVFVLFVAAVLAWGAQNRTTRVLSPMLVLIAAIAKLYAVFALPAYLFTGRRRMIWVIAAAAVVMAAYLLLTFDDFRVVMQAPEGGLLYSYGARILLGDLYHRWSPGDWMYGSLLAQLIAATPVVILSVAGWRWARRRMPRLAADDRSRSVVLAFNLGALTYLGTFVTRKSGDYRLIFVLLTLPLLFEWARSESSTRTVVARAGLIAVVAGLWVGALSPYIGPWDEIGSWAIAVALVLLLAATVPPVPWARFRGALRPAPAQQRSG